MQLRHSIKRDTQITNTTRGYEYIYIRAYITRIKKTRRWLKDTHNAIIDITFHLETLRFFLKVYFSLSFSLVFSNLKHKSIATSPFVFQSIVDILHS